MRPGRGPFARSAVGISSRPADLAEQTFSRVAIAAGNTTGCIGVALLHCSGRFEWAALSASGFGCCYCAWSHALHFVVASDVARTPIRTTTTGESTTID